MSVQDYVKLLNPYEGQSMRVDCPVCRGKRTFTVSKNNGVVLYNCYKADCDTKGMSTVGMSAAEIHTMLAQRKATQEEREPEPMEIPVTFSFSHSHKDMCKFVDKWKLDNVPLLHDIVQHRAVFPIFNKKGKMIDAVGRTLRGDTPKWLRYSGKGSHYSRGNGSVAVVVEDCISAAVAASFSPLVTGVAILGTSMNQKHIDYLRGFDMIVVALDPDAAKKTVAYVTQLRGHGLDSYGLMLHDDLKYRNKDDIQKLKELIKDERIDARNTFLADEAGTDGSTA